MVLLGAWTFSLRIVLARSSAFKDHFDERSRIFPFFAEYFIVNVRQKADECRKKMSTMEQIKKIVFMSIGYIALFAGIT